MLISLTVFTTFSAVAAPPQGYYRAPSIRGNTVVFVAEGDVWKVDCDAAVAAARRNEHAKATRLTRHEGDEGSPAISPDGQTLAFTATYEGPTEVYTMPMSGGLPTRRTYEGGRATVVGWTPGGSVIYATNAKSTLPNTQLFTIDTASGRINPIPLWEASDGCFDGAGGASNSEGTLYFTRMQFQGSHTKRYTGGTAQQIWKWSLPGVEAVPLTTDYDGTSKRPMWWGGRVYFASDRDGIMNVWSMSPDGKDLKQHTRHEGFDVASPSLDVGRIVYQRGADLRMFDISSGLDSPMAIGLDSDFDQTRERWVKKPIDYMTSAHLSPDGSKVAITARGNVFVAPAKQGRFVEVSRKQGVRARDARFIPAREATAGDAARERGDEAKSDDKPGKSAEQIGDRTTQMQSLVVLSDESGEVELWRHPSNGVGEASQLTTGGTVLKWTTLPSPDGRYIAHHNKSQQLWLYDAETSENIKIDQTPIDSFEGLAWSHDSRWLAYVTWAGNLHRQVKVFRVDTASDAIPIQGLLTTDRYDSFSPAFSHDGKWLYFLSDRHFHSVVGSPWGTLQPEPFFDKRTRVYMIPLKPGERSPFAQSDELSAGKKEEKKEEASVQAVPPADEKSIVKKSADDKSVDSKPAKGKPSVEIEFEGIDRRLIETPIPPGNYSNLMVTEKHLFWINTPSDSDSKNSLQSASISNDKMEVKTVLSDIRSAELSLDGKKMLIHKGDALHVIDASPSPPDLAKTGVDLSAWSLSISPREEWRQMFIEAWRLERDYFYDKNMHGVDWKAALERYIPLVDRVSTRAELSDLIAQMVAELSALHIFVSGGDLRRGDDNIRLGSLGAVFARDEKAGGYRVIRVYESDPDEPGRASPLSRPGVEVKAGDTIIRVNGIRALDAPDINAMLRSKAGHQVLLRISTPAPDAGEPGKERDVIVMPITREQEDDLRYHEWEYTRRLKTEQLGNGDIGYVHLRAMGQQNIAEWARGYFPVFNRKGLIIDVRHNRGGNIDSWILNRLLRKAWFYWSQHEGRQPLWNMQYAFRGHMVVLCNERTASDGEAFAEGFRRLGLGKVIGKRTWGGEIWLSSSNFLVDGGIATAAEFGVFGPEGDWLIEGWGVEPDIVVDNPPHATFMGEDAQLDAAIRHLQTLIREKPVEIPPVPVHPDKSLRR